MNLVNIDPMNAYIVHTIMSLMFSEIRTLKDKYKTRREKLSQFKKKVKANMEAQYAAIVKEVLYTIYTY